MAKKKSADRNKKINPCRTKMEKDKDNNQLTLPIRPLLVKEKKSTKRTNSRHRKKAVLVLFLTTFFLSLVFYLKTELPIWWGKITAPLVIFEGNSRPKEFDASAIVAEVKQLTERARGEYGFYVFRFSDGESYGLREKNIFPAASLMKLPVILSLYRQAEAGKIDLTTEYRLEAKDRRDGAGVMPGKPLGTIYTYRQLAEAMGQYSDNTAFTALRRILGDEEIAKTISDLDLTNTSLVDFNTTPENMGRFFKLLYEGNFLTLIHREEIFRFLTKTAFENWIPAGIPPDIRVAHKIGRDLGTFNDAGIVFGENPYVLAIMSKDTREDEAKIILPKISKAIWGFENKR